MKSLLINSIKLLLLFLFLNTATGCKKYLEAKSDNKLAVPSTLNDLQLLLDNYTVMNTRYPYEAGILADEYYVTSADWLALSSPREQKFYIWEKENTYSATFWTDPYTAVFYANVVLDNLDRVTAAPNEQERKLALKGTALFFRAHAFYQLAQIFTPPYDSAAAASQPGLPLRLNADFNQPSVRSSLAQTYKQIIDDFTAAAAMLPATVALKNRPSKPAAFAALTRTCLTMGSYARAFSYADSCLKLYNTLMDYNTLSAAAPAPFTRFNPEVIFQSLTYSASILSQAKAKIDSTLYNAYAANDLRKTLFFKSGGNGTYAFKGDYDGSNNGALFVGFVTDEVYLIKAEAAARLGDAATAMDTLNALLQKRWKAGTFSPLTASGASEALAKVLAERRKELLYRGTRWTDLRRLNLDPNFAVTLQRAVNNQLYTLAPNSPRYTALIPQTVIDITGMQQNP